MSRPRFLPARALPPYTFVPGGSVPHPISHPDGHLHGTLRPPPEPLHPDTWPHNADYLYGIDLFNHGFYWEAHESWEGLWHAAGRRGPIADFLKALIKLAAAGVKHLEGMPRGTCSHAGRAAELWREVQARTASGEDRFLGFSFGDLVTLSLAIERDGWPSPPPFLQPLSEGISQRMKDEG
jgi:hypothetical protein